MSSYVEQEMQLEDYVRELTRPHQRREHYTTWVGGEWRGQNHITMAPALVAQLWSGGAPSAGAESGQRAVYGSKPAARLDALDTAARIDLEASRWVKDLGEDDPADTVACVVLLGALAAGVEGVTRRAIERDVRRWWIRARIVTGWDSPAWHPDATCPQCGVRGSLSVRLADKLAACGDVECGATWDESTIGVLAEHIRVESGVERAALAADVRPTCWCPWPVELAEFAVLCPRCGSRYCHRAVEAFRRVVVDVWAGVSSRELAKRYRMHPSTAVRVIQAVRYGGAS